MQPITCGYGQVAPMVMRRNIGRKPTVIYAKQWGGRWRDLPKQLAQYGFTAAGYFDYCYFDSYGYCPAAGIGGNVGVGFGDCFSPFFGIVGLLVIWHYAPVFAAAQTA